MARTDQAWRILAFVVLGVLLAACSSPAAGPGILRAPDPADVVAEAAGDAAPTPDAALADEPAEAEEPAEPAEPAPDDPATIARAAGLDPEARVVITPTGIVAPVLGIEGERYRVRTPCAEEATVGAGTPIRSATVVLDSGHGGEEPGAVGANGLAEKALNDAVTAHTRALLEAAGVDVVLTRYHDYRVTLQTRAEIANALGARAFVSIHHNGGHEAVLPVPGTEMYHQIASPDSRRLAGLLQEEVFAYFSQFEGIEWHGNLDAGAKWRPNAEGGDYYGILRRSEVPAVISEGLFLSSSLAEAELLARPDVQEGNGAAIGRAIHRYLATDDPGSGFVEPRPRALGSGGGSTGGPRGCVDPPLE